MKSSLFEKHPDSGEHGKSLRRIPNNSAPHFDRRVSSEVHEDDQVQKEDRG